MCTLLIKSPEHFCNNGCAAKKGKKPLFPCYGVCGGEANRETHVLRAKYDRNAFFSFFASVLLLNTRARLRGHRRPCAHNVALFPCFCVCGWLGVGGGVLSVALSSRVDAGRAEVRRCICRLSKPLDYYPSWPLLFNVPFSCTTVQFRGASGKAPGIPSPVVTGHKRVCVLSFSQPTGASIAGLPRCLSSCVGWGEASSVPLLEIGHDGKLAATPAQEHQKPPQQGCPLFLLQHPPNELFVGLPPNLRPRHGRSDVALQSLPRLGHHL